MSATLSSTHLAFILLVLSISLIVGESSDSAADWGALAIYVLSLFVIAGITIVWLIALGILPSRKTRQLELQPAQDQEQDCVPPSIQVAEKPKDGFPLGLYAAIGISAAALAVGAALFALRPAPEPSPEDLEQRAAEITSSVTQEQVDAVMRAGLTKEQGQPESATEARLRDAEGPGRIQYNGPDAETYKKCIRDTGCTLTVQKIGEITTDPRTLLAVGTWVTVQADQASATTQYQLMCQLSLFDQYQPGQQLFYSITCQVEAPNQPDKAPPTTGSPELKENQ